MHHCHQLCRYFFRGFCTVALLISVALAAPSGLPVIPSTVFNVTTYGAIGDGTTNNTTAIQAALNAARNAGGGIVELPLASAPYLCGPITIYSNTRLQIDTAVTLKALPFGTYPNSTTAPSHFITVNTGSTNVAITGEFGTIDGNGAGWWAAFNAGTISNRPRLIQVNRADVVLVSGVTLTNAAMFHLAFSATNNVTIDGITITSPSDAPNSDGIDPAGLHYLIKNSTISVGDDNIAIKPGSTLCGDMTIVDCTFGTGHGLSVGGQTNVGLDGLLVDRCTFTNTTSGLRLKADATQGGLVQHLTYSNITMTNVPYPIVFYSYYVDVGTPGAVSGSNQTTAAKVASWNASPPNSLRSSTISRWQDITLSNVTATGATGYSIIWGLPLATALISNVTLDNVHLSGNRGLEIFNAHNVQLTGNSTVTVPTGLPQFVTYNALALTSPPQHQSAVWGGAATFTVGVVGTSGVLGVAPTYQWSFNGTPLTDGPSSHGAFVSGATTSTLSLSNVQPSAAGSYTVKISNALDTYDSTITTLTASNTPVSITSPPALLSISVMGKVTGDGQELQPVNIPHPNGNIFDQVLLTGAAATIVADVGQITRASFVDLSDDIVQVEFAGAGSLSLVLDGVTAPALPVNYNQNVNYVKGHAGIVITGANETTNVSVFSVGRATAFDPTGAFNFLQPISATNNPANNGSPLFVGHASTAYDGVADIAFIAIASTNGKFGGVRASNASFLATKGMTGLYAPGVQFQGPVFIGDINASATASPVIIIGSSPDTRITGGDLFQANAEPVTVSGLTQLKFTAGTASTGLTLAAQTNRGVLQQNNADVTAQIVVNSSP